MLFKKKIPKNLHEYITKLYLFQRLAFLILGYVYTEDFGNLRISFSDCQLSHMYI